MRSMRRRWRCAEALLPSSRFHPTLTPPHPTHCCEQGDAFAAPHLPRVPSSAWSLASQGRPNLRALAVPVLPSLPPLAALAAQGAPPGLLGAAAHRHAPLFAAQRVDAAAVPGGDSVLVAAGRGDGCVALCSVAIAEAFGGPGAESARMRAALVQHCSRAAAAAVDAMSPPPSLRPWLAASLGEANGDEGGAAAAAGWAIPRNAWPDVPGARKSGSVPSASLGRGHLGQLQQQHLLLQQGGGAGAVLAIEDDAGAEPAAAVGGKKRGRGAAADVGVTPRRGGGRGGRGGSGVARGRGRGPRGGNRGRGGRGQRRLKSGSSEEEEEEEAGSSSGSESSGGSGLSESGGSGGAEEGGPPAAAGGAGDAALPFRVAGGDAPEFEVVAV